MKIKSLTPLVNLSDEPILHPDGSRASFKSVAVECLSIKPGGDKDGSLSYRCYKLAKALSSNLDYVSISIEDAAFLKTRVGECGAYNNVVIGRMWDMLDGRSIQAVEELPAPEELCRMDAAIDINHKSAE